MVERRRQWQLWRWQWWRPNVSALENYTASADGTQKKEKERKKKKKKRKDR